MLAYRYAVCHFSHAYDCLSMSYNSSKVMVISNRPDDPHAERENIRSVRVDNQEIDSRELFQSERELRIRHDGNLYRLRLTSLNKLILTK